MELDQNTRQAAYERRELSRFGPDDAHDFAAVPVDFSACIEGHKTSPEALPLPVRDGAPGAHRLDGKPETARKLKGGLE